MGCLYLLVVFFEVVLVSDYGSCDCLSIWVVLLGFFVFERGGLACVVMLVPEVG